MKASRPRPSLHRQDLHQEPLAQFARWYEDAGQAEELERDAMALATADPSGRPSVRMVLLKGFDQEGIRFFTHYDSRKGRELADNPHAALAFYWHLSGRQVRIEGLCRRLPARESDEYFAGRAGGSRLGAHASAQSRVIAHRSVLELALADAADRFQGRSVPRPPGWGGFLLRPSVFEFWQAGENRLHDRFRYEHENGHWRIDRLAP